MERQSRATAAETEEREDVVYDLLSRCTHKSQIKRRLLETYGIKARAAEDYISRARERLLVEASRAKDDLRSESLGFYLATLRNKDATIREKLQARERIDRLFGLEAPARQHHSFDFSNLSDEDVKTLESIVTKLT